MKVITPGTRFFGKLFCRVLGHDWRRILNSTMTCRCRRCHAVGLEETP